MSPHEVSGRQLEDAVRRLERVTDGPYDLSSDWLLRSGFVALAEEDGRHFDEDQAARLGKASQELGVSQLIAIANDRPFLEPRDLTRGFDASAKGLMDFANVFSGMNALVVPAVGLHFAVLCTVDDFHIIAGPREFVLAYRPDFARARAEFIEFCDGQIEQLRPAALRALRLMAWIDEH